MLYSQNNHQIKRVETTPPSLPAALHVFLMFSQVFIIGLLLQSAQPSCATSTIIVIQIIARGSCEIISGAATGRGSPSYRVSAPLFKHHPMTKAMIALLFRIGIRSTQRTNQAGSLLGVIIPKSGVI